MVYNGAIPGGQNETRDGIDAPAYFSSLLEPSVLKQQAAFD